MGIETSNCPSIDYSRKSDCSPSQAAIILYFRLSQLDRDSYVEKGLIVIEVEKRELWKHFWDDEKAQYCHSLDRWMFIAAPFSRSTCYDARDTVKELLKDLTSSELLGIPRCNCKILLKLSSDIRRKVCEAARTCSEDIFSSMIEKHYPDQHFEATKQIILKPSYSEYAAITEDIEYAKGYFGTQSRSEALLAVLTEWRQGLDGGSNVQDQRRLGNEVQLHISEEEKGINTTTFVSAFSVQE